MSGDDFIAPHCDQEIAVLFEDDDLIVIDKPSGLLSLSGKNPLNKDSVHHRLVQQYSGVTMVHRLDFGTSGVMVLARNKVINAHLTKQFQARKITKHYLALLFGHLPNDNGVIDAPIAKDDFPHQKICHQTGKAALTHYRVLQRFIDSANGAKISRVLFTPTTGRTHQLRVHSQEIGNPIIGCDLYADIIDGVNTQELSCRLCLHASRLEFEHPTSGEPLSFEARCEF
ncbi:MAG: tRNA pseudouridine32 synthase/23S rRNA pseudouridine746 synthase [Arenicella sp.]|jgi:tRNA pseudouridine32 synthase/23S rRNA pseudouridine746 synthase